MHKIYSFKFVLLWPDTYIYIVALSHDFQVCISIYKRIYKLKFNVSASSTLDYVQLNFIITNATAAY